MGERGPRPAPSALKRAEGIRSDRINDAEPRPTVPEEPQAPPGHLDDVERAIWEALAPDLHRAGVLTPWDLESFTRYCELGSTIREVRDQLKRIGTVIKGRRDSVVVSPFWRVYRDALEEQRKLAREFGLTPSARSTLRAVPRTGSSAPTWEVQGRAG